MSVHSETAAQEVILRILQTDENEELFDPSALLEDESNITQGEQNNVHKEFDPAKPRDRKLTEKGKSYQENIRDTKRKQSYIKLKRRIEKIGTSIESVRIPATLEAERDILDLDKEEFNEACRAYEQVLDSPVDKEEAIVGLTFVIVNIQNVECGWLTIFKR